MDIVKQIRDSHQGREPERLTLKYRLMRGSNFAFLRATCPLFYARLPLRGVLKSAPPAWCCGDLHVQNFGSYKGDNRLVYFDINDFDEALLAPASWDLVRLAASTWVAAAEGGLARSELRALCRAQVDAYADALATGKPQWVERDTAEGSMRALLDSLRARQRPAHLDSRTRLKDPKGQRRVLRVDNGKALQASPAQRRAVTSFMEQFAQTQPDPRFFKVLDVARRVAGTGSLGMERYVVLVRGKGSPDGNYLLDLKRAGAPSLAALTSIRQPAWASHAERVVELQRRLQAVPAAFLHAVHLGNKPFVLRALHPSQDRVDFAAAARQPGERMRLATSLARIAAWAQLRSAGRQGAAGPDDLIDFGRRSKWREKLSDTIEEAALQVQADAAAFNAAFDAGAFGVQASAENG